MTRKKTRHALVSSIISLVLCCSMLIGTTFAWFTDEVTSENNIIKSGTLDAEMNWQNPGDTTWTDASTGPIFTYKYWEPGYVDIKNIQLKNVGDLAFKYQLRILPNSATADALKLAEVIDVYVAPVGSVTTRDQIAGMQKLGTLKDLMAQTTGVDDGVLLPSAEKRPDADRVGLVDPTVEFYDGEVALTLALKMQEEAGNEYQDLSIGGGFSVQLLASQFTWEKDSFDHLYDEYSKWPVSASGTGTLDEATGVVYFHVYDKNNKDSAGNPTKIGSVTVPREAMEDPTKEVTFTVAEDTAEPEFTISDGQKSETINLSVSNLKAGNTAKVKYEHYVGKGLENVTAYHYDQEMDEGDRAYNATSGYINLQSATFSPFTIVYDVPVVVVTPVPGDPSDPSDPGEPSEKPTATVTARPEYVGTPIEWGEYGQWSPTNKSQQLEAAYLFTANHTSEEAAASPYAQWHCDFYVKMDRIVPDGAIFLGGNYGSFGWVGFENNGIEVDANEEVPLLGSVTANPWTYEQVVDFVGEFICGVAQTGDALDGGKFTVMLRLTNPDDESDYFNVATIEHIFE